MIDWPRMGDTTPGVSIGSVVLHERVVVRLLPALSAAAGGLDAVCVAKLGGAFASVITGNLVQLGRAIAMRDDTLLVRATVAVAGYALGVATGTVGLRHVDSGWQRRTTAMAMGETVLLACVAFAWLVTGGHPDAGIAPLILALSGTAMGMQSAITISSRVPGASTTYLTGTLTGVVRRLVGVPHRGAGSAAGAVELVALLAGATVAGVLLRVAPLWAPILPLVLVGVVVAIAATSTRRTPRS